MADRLLAVLLPLRLDVEVTRGCRSFLDRSCRQCHQAREKLVLQHFTSIRSCRKFLNDSSILQSIAAYNRTDMERPLSSHSIRLSLFFYISLMTLQGAGCFDDESV
jgi:hypothetical protein